MTRFRKCSEGSDPRYPCVVPSAEDLKTRIEASIPEAVVEVEDLTGLAQHRLVYDVFGAEVGGPIHALSIKTQTPVRT